MNMRGCKVAASVEALRRWNDGEDDVDIITPNGESEPDGGDRDTQYGGVDLGNDSGELVMEDV